MFGRSRGAGGAARPRAARVTLAAATPQVSESALVARVAGGSPRAVSRANAELELDASASHDPDGCGTAALQAGACSAQESGVAVAWACALRSDPKRACRARGTGAIARLRGGARLRLDVGALDVDAEDAIVLSAVVSKVRPPRPARAGAAASHARTGAGLSGPSRVEHNQKPQRFAIRAPCARSRPRCVQKPRCGPRAGSRASPRGLWAQGARFAEARVVLALQAEATLDVLSLSLCPLRRPPASPPPLSPTVSPTVPQVTIAPLYLNSARAAFSAAGPGAAADGVRFEWFRPALPHGSIQRSCVQRSCAQRSCAQRSCAPPGDRVLM